MSGRAPASKGRRPFVRLARSALAAVFFAAFGIGGLFIGCAAFPALLLMGGRPRAGRAMRRLVAASWRLFVVAARAVGLFRISISDEDRALLASLRGRVVAANHVTLLDVVALSVFLPDATSIAKAAAGRNPFYSRIVKSVFIMNDDPAGAVRDAVALLREGVNVIVFPEGTRARGGAPERRMRRGAARIALEAGAPVLPVFVSCEPPTLGKGQAWHDVADRTVTWTLRAREEISARAPSASQSRHAAAAALTREIEERLWKEEERPCSGK